MQAKQRLLQEYIAKTSMSLLLRQAAARALLFAARAGGEIFGNGTVVERNDTTAELNASSDAELWKVEL